MEEDIPKPFGLPNENGFYKVNESNELALDTAVELIKLWPGKLEFLALSGYIEREYPETVKDEDIDFRYHIIAGIDSSLPEALKQSFISSDLTQQDFEKAYEIARQRMHWHHKPRLLLWDIVSFEEKIKNQNTEEFLRGSLIHSLVLRAVPLWDKPKTFKQFKEYSLTPFEYLQQTVFQFYSSRTKNPVSVYPVTDDKAKRYILD